MKIKYLIASVLFVLSLVCSFLSHSLSRLTEAPEAGTTPTPLTPAYIPPECNSNLLATLPVASNLAQATPDQPANLEISAETQREVFKQVAFIVETAYVYPDYNGRDWSAIKSKFKQQIESGLDTVGFYAAMKAMISGFGDEHSGFYSPVDVARLEAKLRGNNDFVGIGAYILPLAEKRRVSIVTVFPGSPADESGLKAHDSILAVDGLPVAENGKVYSNLTHGAQCSTAVLSIQTPGQRPHDVMLVRYRVRSSLLIDAQLIPTTDGSRIGYILLPTFFDRTIPQQVEDALTNFGQLDGLILDNRVNGGGSNDVLYSVLAYFTGGTLGEFKSRTISRPLAITPDPIANSQSVPLVVLVGQDTVSYGEIFAGVLQDSGRAKVVGETTTGNVETLHGYTLKDGSQLWIAQETFDPANSHANWESNGITPDVKTYADWDTFTFETDPSIAVALKLLGHK
jgi:C-terminal peptidase prc